MSPARLMQLAQRLDGVFSKRASLTVHCAGVDPSRSLEGARQIESQHIEHLPSTVGLIPLARHTIESKSALQLSIRPLVCTATACQSVRPLTALLLTTAEYSQYPSSGSRSSW